VSKLKFNKGQKYFIYKNSGETMAMNNASSRILIRRMKRQKCQLVGEYHYVMPYNIHFPFERDFIRQIFKMNEKLLDVMMYNLDNGIVKRIKSNFIYNLAAFFVGIQKVGGNVNSFFYKVDSEKCIKCGLCVKKCPHDNIYIKKGKSNSTTIAICVCDAHSSAQQMQSALDFYRAGALTELMILRT
jgi:NAD-dependent dihydropyrimidine dehydrogenase PreA subunit